MIEPTWVEADQVACLNALIGQTAGKVHTMLDRGLLESACANPRNEWAYKGVRDVHELAAVLTTGIARNHPFSDGNKRASFEAGLLFLHLNG